MPKDSATGISAFTIIMSSSVGMSKTRPLRFCTMDRTELTKACGTLHSKLRISSSSLGSLSSRSYDITDFRVIDGLDYLNTSENQYYPI